MPTRGERNNNPLNIDRTGINWQGMAADQSSDTRFIVFTDPVYCFRAAARIIRVHYHGGRNTVALIVSSWAPGNENDTASYIADVARHVGVDPNAVLNITNGIGDPSQLLPLLRAMVIHENGENIYYDSQIQHGMDLEEGG